MNMIGSYNRKINKMKSTLTAIFYVSLFLGACGFGVWSLHYFFEMPYLDIMYLSIGIGIINAINGIGIDIKK